MNPAQLNTKIQFYNVSTTQNQYAGSEQDEPTLLLETRAQRLPVTQNMQFAIEAGASVWNQDFIFRIRQRQEFTPAKAMFIVSGGIEYEINAVRPVDEKRNKDAVFHSSNYMEIVGIRRQ